MSPNQWERVKELLSGALALTPEERRPYILQAAADDPDVAADAISLMEASDSNSFTGLLKTTANSEPAMPTAGLVIDNSYRLEKRLASGGFADAWLAASLKLHNRSVVLKILRQHDESWFEEAFAKELRVLSQIDHPGIVQPLGAGRLPDGRPYIVMQYVSGPTLRQLMQAGPLPLNRMADLIRKIGAAVDAAHANNVYHCDLKPENVIVQTLQDGREEPRLIDFGIARIRQSATSWQQTVHIAGTLSYMAPEQLTGRVGTPTDVYGLAVICYEMLTGRVPFPASDPIALSQLQRSKPTPASQFRSGLPESADRFIAQALSFEPAARQETPGQFTAQLATSLVDADQVAAAKRPRPSRRLAIASLVFFIVAAAGSYLRYHQRTSGYHQKTNVYQQKTNERLDAAKQPKLTLQIQIVERDDAMPQKLKEGAYLLSGPFRVQVTPAQPGHIYMISETAGGPDGMTILFPSPTANGNSSSVGANHLLRAPENSWFNLDQGTRQRLWLIWATTPISELEAAKRWANAVDRGAIPDPGIRLRIRSLLSHAPRARISLDTGAATVDSQSVLPIDFESR